jgi:hypothetical protein
MAIALDRIDFEDQLLPLPSFSSDESDNEEDNDGGTKSAESAAASSAAVVGSVTTEPVACGVRIGCG